jgi:hypothetical protein
VPSRPFRISKLIQVKGNILDQIAIPVTTRSGAALLPRPRPGERPVLQAGSVQAAQMDPDPVRQRRRWLLPRRTA